MSNLESENSEDYLVEFEDTLKELSLLKAPGVSGSRIQKLTEIAINNYTVCIKSKVLLLQTTNVFTLESHTNFFV